MTFEVFEIGKLHATVKFALNTLIPSVESKEGKDFYNISCKS